MGRKTDEWAELLEGTTPGPWEVETIPELRYSNGETWEELGHHVVYGESGPLFTTDEQTVEDAEQHQDNEANIRLAAAAPDTVAEVIRLRRALEAQRDRFRSHAKADSYLAKVSTVPLVPFYGDQARLLDLILNGDTDD